MKRITIFLWVFWSMVSQAQIPMKYSLLPMKGEVLKMEVLSYPNVSLDSNRRPITVGLLPTRFIVNIKDGQPIMSRNYQMQQGGAAKLTTKVMYHYDNNRLVQVEEFSNSTDADAGTTYLLSTAMPTYQNGLMVAEEVTNAERRLLVSYTYQKGADDLLLVEQYYYERDERRLGVKYGVRSDFLGRSILYGINTQDTFFMSRRVANEGDSVITAQCYQTNEGIKTPYISRSFIGRDSVGNAVSIVDALKYEGSPTTYTANIIRYQYAGQPDFEAEASKTVTLENLIDGWFNRQENIKLIIRRPTNEADLSGNFETANFFNTDPTTVTTPDSWKRELAEAIRGEWKYDPSTQVLGFVSAGETVINVRVSFDAEVLVLQPINATLNDLRMSRRVK